MKYKQPVGLVAALTVLAAIAAPVDLTLNWGVKSVALVVRAVISASQLGPPYPHRAARNLPCWVSDEVVKPSLVE